jgi:TonB family protein
MHKEVWPDSPRVEPIATVSLTIESDGHVSDVALDMSTTPGFGEAAVQALKKWRFDPVTSHGKPARVRLKIPVVGRLEGKIDQANQPPLPTPGSGLPFNQSPQPGAADRLTLI